MMDKRQWLSKNTPFLQQSPCSVILESGHFVTTFLPTLLLQFQGFGGLERDFELHTDFKPLTKTLMLERYATNKNLPKNLEVQKRCKNNTMFL